jgi:hypothetical protein
MKRIALVVFLGYLIIALPSGAQKEGQTANPGIGGISYPCNGMVKRLPADLLGREYRGQCLEGIEVWTWASTIPAHFWKAQNTVFVVVINRRNDMASVVRDDFHVVSADPKHPNDPNRMDVIDAIDPVKIADGLARLATPSYSEPLPRELYSNVYDAHGRYIGQVVSTDPLWPLVSALREQQERQANQQNQQSVFAMSGWVVQTAYAGGAISPGGSLSGYVYFGKVKGVNPWLTYGPKEWMDRGKFVSIPLGNWPIETGQAPQ